MSLSFQEACSSNNIFKTQILRIDDGKGISHLYIFNITGFKETYDIPTNDVNKLANIRTDIEWFHMRK